MKFLRYLGKFLISAGCGVLMFVGWTLYGTGIYTEQQQDQLLEDFLAQPDFKIASGSNGDDEITKVGRPPKNFSPAPGHSAFVMRIPKMWGQEPRVVVEGVDTEELRKGPGHYPQCRAGFERPYCTEFDAVWPGEKGRVVISGHRTTYGQPFWDLDELSDGDEIMIDTKWGDFKYVVFDKRVVEPEDPTVVIPIRRAELVLTTCNPKFSASQRLIVYAELEEVTA